MYRVILGLFTWVLFAAQLHDTLNAAFPSSNMFIVSFARDLFKDKPTLYENTGFEENESIEQIYFQEENANEYIVNDQEKPEISLLEDTELVVQGQLQKKRKVKIEQDGVGTAQGCLSLPTCKLSLVPVPWGKWSAQNLWYFNPRSEHFSVAITQEHSGVVFSSVVLLLCDPSSC